MAKVIRVGVCPRCGHEVRADTLHVVAADLLREDEDAAAFWPGGRADVPPDGIRVCGDCREDLAQVRSDALRWEREARAYEEGR